MRPDEPLVASTAVLVNNKAWVNSNGWPLGLLVSPQPPASLPTPPMAKPPPAWLAVVIDSGMAETALAAATEGLSQALQQLPPHTHLLVAVADRAASFLDLSSPRPQSWVLAGHGAPPPPEASRRLLRASGVRPTPLSACGRGLTTALRSLRHSPVPQGASAAAADSRQQQQADAGGNGSVGGGGGGAVAAGEAAASAARRVGALANAIELSLQLLATGIAQWDARHKAELSAANAAATGSGGSAAPPSPPAPQAFPAKPMHAARVLVLTAGGDGSFHAAVHAAAQAATAAARPTFERLAARAASLDAQIDTVTGDAAAPALPLLLDAADATGGAVLHQPGLLAPLAANVAALATRRLGWDAFLDVRTPAGVKVSGLAGPGLTKDGALPASVSPVDPQPVAPSSGGGGGGAGGAAAASPLQQQQRGTAAVQERRVARPAVASTRLSVAAAAAPGIDRGRFYGAALELSSDLQPGVALELQVLWEWTTADGRRVRQVSSTHLQVGERLSDFLSGLDLETGSLLIARRLIATALSSAGGIPGPKAAAGGWGRALRRGALADARLSAGLALQHAAQRMGTARVARRGLFGFGGQTVWELPPALVPLAVALYLLQAGPLLNAGDEDGSSPQAADRWRLRAHQLLSAAPAVGACMVAPALYLQAPADGAGSVGAATANGGGAAAANGGTGGGGGGSSGSGGAFEPVPPVTLAVGPQSLAVLDCGTELLVFAGPALTAGAAAATMAPAAAASPTRAGGAPLPPPASPPAANGAAASSSSPVKQQQKPPVAPAAAPPGPATAAAAGGDLPNAAAPAVQFAQRLARSRSPVPAISVLEDATGVSRFMRRLLPLHFDVLPLQMALLPALRGLTPQDHGRLLQWHAQWWDDGDGFPAPPGGGGFGHFCAAAGVSLPVEGGLMEVVDG